MSIGADPVGIMAFGLMMKAISTISVEAIMTVDGEEVVAIATFIKMSVKVPEVALELKELDNRHKSNKAPDKLHRDPPAVKPLEVMSVAVAAEVVCPAAVAEVTAVAEVVLAVVEAEATAAAVGEATS